MKKYNLKSRLQESNLNSLRDELTLKGSLGRNNLSGELGEQLAAALAGTTRRVINLNTITASSAFADLVVPIDELGALKKAVEIELQQGVTISPIEPSTAKAPFLPRSIRDALDHTGAVLFEAGQGNVFVKGFASKITAGGEESNIYKQILRNPSKFAFYSVKCSGKLTPKGGSYDPLGNTPIKGATASTLFEGIKAAREWYFNTDEFKSELQELPDNDELKSMLAKKVNYEENITGLNLGLISVRVKKAGRGIAGVGQVEYAMGHSMFDLESNSLASEYNGTKPFFTAIGAEWQWETFGEAYDDTSRENVNTKISLIQGIQNQLSQKAHVLSIEELNQIRSLIDSFS